MMNNIKKVTQTIAAFFAVWAALHLSVMLILGLSSEIKHSDAILIFGNKVETSGEPSERLKSRLDQGIKLYEQKMASLIIVSGGFGREGFDEALIMKDYLMKRGVPEDAIITDQKGSNTYQTAKRTACSFQLAYAEFPCRKYRDGQIYHDSF
ncbi:MAG: hypothetical protein CVV64_18315 [Candidatus Wallbacteria bacterium HGW-Wallbacteria-1]|jgi:vancomycin permeability regulator SanA|uniref:DUF218 domain-containing protein n=1 Tax=Candidatus Wallbacteria bacterium HGW-Wallbacteria-1 TaxID=2013854 RepID=A0A2N1PJP7_9BACT|nr:MAG: hypothetical protein CVV64_18315 [Candidatus Wallbacteria bacterium HGW-Wallbacteria-1]